MCGCARQTGMRFTLVEMLVVIAIISILAMLLMPALMVALDSSRLAGCTSQLRQIGLGIHSYNQDYQTMPLNNSFATVLMAPYLAPGANTVKQKLALHLCPKSDYRSYASSGINWTQGSYSYTRHGGCVNYATGAWYNPPVRLERIHQPGQKILEFDGGGAGFFNYGAIPLTTYPQDGVTDSGTWYADIIRAWHNQETNCLYADNHVMRQVLRMTVAQARAVTDLP